MRTRNHTGFVRRDLTGNGGLNPTYTLGGGSVSFNLSSLPISEGGKAYYLAGLSVEVFGTLTGDAAQTNADSYSRLIRSFFGSFALRRSMFGTACEPQNWTAARLMHAGYVMSGYQHRGKAVYGTGILAQGAALAIAVRTFIPLGLGLGDKPHQTWPLALEYKDAILEITPPAATQLTTLIDSASAATNLKIRVSAVMLPQPELVMRPAVEYQVYDAQSTASLINDLRYDDFGAKTGYGGNVEGEAGVIWAGLETSYEGLTGASTLYDITQLSVPFRDILDLTDVRSIGEDARNCDPNANVIAVLSRLVTGSTGSFALGYPYGFDDSSSGNQAAGTQQNTYSMPTGSPIIPLVNPSPDLELSKVQKVSRTTNIRVTTAGTMTAGSCPLSVIQVKRFTAAAQEMWKRQVFQSGLAREVLGPITEYSDLQWSLKNMRKQLPGDIEPAKTNFLPLKLRNMGDRRLVRE